MSNNIKWILFFIGGIVLGALITFGVMNSLNKKKAVDISSVVGASVFKVDGQVYSTSELPGDTAMEYFLLENNIYNAKENFFNQTALRVALAHDSKKQVSSSVLPKLTDLLPLPTVSDEEAKVYYNKIIAQMGKGVLGGQTFEQIKPQLVARMAQQKSTEIISKKIQELQIAGRIQMLMTKPVAPQVALNLTGFPARGNLNASATLVEVADYLCPHCRESIPAIESLYKEFKNNVKFVHISYPLAPAGLSGELAKGGFCATQQEKFWEYHNLAFQVPWEKNTVPAGENAEKYTKNVVTEVAKSAGLDIVKFGNCLSSPEAANYIKKVQGMFNESTGFQGTPTFYLNNKLIQVSPDQLESTLKAALKN